MPGSVKRAVFHRIAALAVAITLPSSAATQVSAADSASVLLDAARDFEAQGLADVAAAVYRLIVDRYPATPAAAEARTRLATVQVDAASGSGRVEMSVWMAGYGAWLGVAVPAAFGAGSNEAYGVGLLVGGPVGFLAGRGLANALDLNEGQARAITLGGTWGTWQGFGWREVLDLGVEQDCQLDPYCYDLEGDDEEMFTSMIVGGLAGIGVGALLSQREMTPGTASAVNFGALWGTWFGVAGGVLMDLEDDDLLAATLVGGDAALVATAFLAPRWNLSRSRARLVSIAGVLGGLAGAGVDLLVEPESEKIGIGIPLATSILGLGIGALATRGDDDSAEGPGAPLDGALLRFGDGRLALGVPFPTPRLVSTDHRGTSGGRAAVSFEVFRADVPNF
jgi:hypothetical protein